MSVKLNLLILILFFAKPSLASYRVPTKQFKAELNSTKTHYFVSLKGIDDKHPGYTAVFDAETHEMKFKVEEEFCKDMIFLSPNGKRFTVLSLVAYNNLYPQFKAAIYDSTGLKFAALFPVFEYSSATEFLDVIDDNSSVNFYFRDSIHSISVTDWKMATVRNDSLTSDFESSFFYKQTPIGESLFSLPELQFEGLTLKEHVLKDLNSPDGTIDCANEFISMSITIDSTGKVVQLEVSSYAVIIHEGKYVKSFYATSSEMQQKITGLIQNYSFNKADLHDGADFWVYKGGFYI